MIMKLLPILLFVGVVSCKAQIKEELDYFVYDKSGFTVFSEPKVVNTKDLHIESGVDVGESVVVEGEVVSWGEYKTHFVLNDKFGSLLVVTTDLPHLDKIAEFEGGKVKVKVLGVVERGKKGLPFVQAKVLKTNSNKF